MARPEPLRVRVLDVVRETAEATSFLLEPVDGADIPYAPGQFLTVRVPSSVTGSAARSYSLSSTPTRDEPMKITVKRTPDGYVSNWLCDNVGCGSELELLRPAGQFTPAAPDVDLLLVAGGSGITPVMSILKACLDSAHAQMTLLYANRDEASVIFAAELRELTRESAGRLTVIHWLESVQGIPSVATLRDLLAPYASREAFVCGPGAFMDATTEALASLGAEPARIHTEKFVSLTGDPFRDGAREPASNDPSGRVEVLLDGEKHEVAWPRGQRLLDVLLTAGLDAPYSCREGACSACACILLEGEVKMENNQVLDAHDLADGLVLSCQAVALTDLVRISYDD